MVQDNLKFGKPEIMILGGTIKSIPNGPAGG
jgi:hypothetical protein